MNLLTEQHGAVHHHRRAGLGGGRLVGQVARLQPGKDQTAQRDVAGGEERHAERGKEEQGTPPTECFAFIGAAGERTAGGEATSA